MGLMGMHADAIYDAIPRDRSLKYNILVLQYICACGLSGLFMFLGCIIYPAGWKSTEVQRLCGFTAESFVIGNCTVGWAYILAMVGIFDALFLAILALVLATRQENWTDNDFAFGSSRCKYICC